MEWLKEIVAIEQDSVPENISKDLIVSFFFFFFISYFGMNGSGEDQHQRQQDVEKQGPSWVPPTPFSEKKPLISNNGQGIRPCNSISLELDSASAANRGNSSFNSRGFGFRIPELYSSTCATSFSTSPVYGYNASLHTIPMINPTTGFSQIHFRNIASAFDADKKLSFSPNHFFLRSVDVFRFL